MADRLRKVVLLSNHIMCNFICLNGKLEKIQVIAALIVYSTKNDVTWSSLVASYTRSTGEPNNLHNLKGIRQIQIY
jgi:hypothetical protein